MVFGGRGLEYTAGGTRVLETQEGNTLIDALAGFLSAKLSRRIAEWADRRRKARRDAGQFFDIGLATSDAERFRELLETRQGTDPHG